MLGLGGHIPDLSIGKGKDRKHRKGMGRFEHWVKNLLNITLSTCLTLGNERIGTEGNIGKEGN